jgi:hypothetical protein
MLGGASNLKVLPNVIVLNYYILKFSHMLCFAIIFSFTGNSQHILICGDLDSTDLREFFSELFHEDHEMSNLQAVIVQPNPPSDDLHRILRDPIFSLIIHFLQGSVVRCDHNCCFTYFYHANDISCV